MWQCGNKGKERERESPDVQQYSSQVTTVFKERTVFLRMRGSLLSLLEQKGHFIVAEEERHDYKAGKRQAGHHCREQMVAESTVTGTVR